MPNKQKTTFQKRQKELARQEKQRRKMERRAERKLLKTQRGPGQDLTGEETTEVLRPQAAPGDDPARPAS
ncbi:MAG: hypothetical protein HY236_06415 [Acidobacteria bacterium]|nr:hypothetical protein [Acidobacteriota bacterium]